MVMGCGALYSCKAWMRLGLVQVRCVYYTPKIYIYIHIKKAGKADFQPLA